MIKDVLKYLQPNAAIPIDMETTVMLVNALKEALAQPEQEPVAWMSPSWIDPNTRGWQSDSFESIPIEGWLPLYTTLPQRTWIGLEGAEAGWFCHTDFLNARKYTKKQRQHICCQLLSEAQSWDIEEYQLMMHDSTKLKETT